MKLDIKGIKEWQRLADGKFDAIEHELINLRKDLQNIVYRHEFENLRDRIEKLETILSSQKKSK